MPFEDYHPYATPGKKLYVIKRRIRPKKQQEEPTVKDEDEGEGEDEESGWESSPFNENPTPCPQHDGDTPLNHKNLHKITDLMEGRVKEGVASLLKESEQLGEAPRNPSRHEKVGRKKKKKKKKEPQERQNVQSTPKSQDIGGKEQRPDKRHKREKPRLNNSPNEAANEEIRLKKRPESGERGIANSISLASKIHGRDRQQQPREKDFRAMLKQEAADAEAAVASAKAQYDSELFCDHSETLEFRMPNLGKPRRVTGVQKEITTTQDEMCKELIMDDYTPFLQRPPTRRFTIKKDKNQDDMSPFIKPFRQKESVLDSSPTPALGQARRMTAKVRKDTRGEISPFVFRESMESISNRTANLRFNHKQKKKKLECKGNGNGKLRHGNNKHKENLDGGYFSRRALKDDNSGFTPIKAKKTAAAATAVEGFDVIRNMIPPEMPLALPRRIGLSAPPIRIKPNNPVPVPAIMLNDNTTTDSDRAADFIGI